MNISMIAVHYQLEGPPQPEETGPARLVAHGLADDIRAQGHAVSLHTIRPRAYAGEADAVAHLTREVARDARRGASTDFTLVLGGNCVTCLGALAALPPSRAGVVWVDAHGDFNTPETSPSGMLNGMPLAIACGRCHPEVLSPIRDQPVAESAALLVGARDLDPGEARALASSGVKALSVNELAAGGRAAVDAALSRLAGFCDTVYIHVDIDGIDPADAPGVKIRTPGGIAEADVVALIRRIGERIHIGAAGIAEYDPRFDEGDATRDLCFRLARELVRAAAS